VRVQDDGEQRRYTMLYDGGCECKTTLHDVVRRWPRCTTGGAGEVAEVSRETSHSITVRRVTYQLLSNSTAESEKLAVARPSNVVRKSTGSLAVVNSFK
jgi:hypothetical protein